MSNPDLLPIIKDKYAAFVKALKKLAKIETTPINELIDEDLYEAGFIQRFEFTIEVTWKLLKTVLEYEGIVEVKTPRDVIRNAAKFGFLSEGEIWIDMLETRNTLSHTYNEVFANRAFKKIKTIYLEQFKALSSFLASRYDF
jgi:nucleotidyltransferase substrate binding protein (TIGR01987 family)